MRAVVCIPWRAGEHWRGLAFEYVSDWWQSFELEVFTADGGSEGSMNRSRARNQAARAAGDWTVAIFADADTIGQPEQIRQAIEIAAEDPLKICHPFTRFEGMPREATEQLYQGKTPTPSRRWKIKRGSPGGIFAIGRELWQQTGGFDEGFTGWGFEDVAFATAALTLGRTHRIQGTIQHLWHPLAPEKNRRHPEWQANYARRMLYKEAEKRPDRMRALLDQLGVTA